MIFPGLLRIANPDGRLQLASGFRVCVKRAALAASCGRGSTKALIRHGRTLNRDRRERRMSKLSHKLFSSAWPAVRRLIFLCAALAFAGDRAEPPVIALARTAPPEFFADAVVRLIHAGKIPNRDQEIELLEDAFAAAATAKEPVRLIAVTGTPPDTRELY